MRTTSDMRLAWRKSSYSDSEGAECVEVAEATSAVRIRDSKDPEGPILTVPRGGWTRFVRYATQR